MSLCVCCGLHGIVLCVDVRLRYSTVLVPPARFLFSNDNEGLMGDGGEISLMPAAEDVVIQAPVAWCGSAMLRCLGVRTVFGGG